MRNSKVFSFLVASSQARPASKRRAWERKKKYVPQEGEGEVTRYVPTQATAKVSIEVMQREISELNKQIYINIQMKNQEVKCNKWRKISWVHLFK